MYFKRLHYKGTKLQSVSDTRPRCQTPLSTEAAPRQTIIETDVNIFFFIQPWVFLNVFDKHIIDLISKSVKE